MNEILAGTIFISEIKRNSLICYSGVPAARRVRLRFLVSPRFARRDEQQGPQNREQKKVMQMHPIQNLCTSVKLCFTKISITKISITKISISKLK